MAEELAKIENAVVEATEKKAPRGPQRNYKKELEAAQAELDRVTKENLELHCYVDTLFKQSQDVTNSLLITKNALAQANKAIGIMGDAYDLAKNQLASVVNYLEKETK